MATTSEPALDRRRKARRRGLATLACLVALTLPGARPAAGDPPARASSQYFSLSCRTATAQGTVALDVGLGGDVETAIAVWSPGVDADREPPSFTTAGSLTVVADGSALRGEGTLFDVASGEAAGEASFDLGLEPAHTERELSRRRQGNLWLRGKVTRLWYAVSGAIIAFGKSFPADACVGALNDSALFAVQPHAIAANHTASVVECEAVDSAGRRLVLVIDGEDLSGVVFEPNSTTRSLFLFGEGRYVEGSTIRGEMNVHDEATGDRLGSGTIEGELRFEPKQERFVRSFQGGFERIEAHDFGASGVLVLPDDSAFLLDACTGTLLRSHLHAGRPAEPDSQRAPAENDEPGSAEPLPLGRRVLVHTETAGAASEVPASCPTVEDGAAAAAMAHTVWYRFAGTGAPVVLDTDGSDFDTALAVYAVVDGQLVEIACGDDLVVHRYVNTLQARLTVETARAATYLVQVGGASGQRGTLRLTTRAG